MKITKAMVDSIVQKETYKKFEDKINKAEKDFRDEVKKELSSNAEKVPQKLVDEGWIKTENTVNLKLSDNYRDSTSVDLDEYFPIKQNEYEHKLKATAKVKKLYELKKSLIEERDKFKSKLRSIVSAFTSHKPLIENMPEMEIYFADEIRAQSMSVIPYEQIKDIRSQLVRP